MRVVLAGAVCALALSACGQWGLVDAPLSSQPALQSGIQKQHFDPRVRPQDDFYHAINGHWLATTPIPPDKTDYGAFSQIADTTEQQLHAIIEAAARTETPAGSEKRKIGDLYASFMDEADIERKGLTPLREAFSRIDAIDNQGELVRTMAYLQQIGVDVPLAAMVSQDPKDAQRYTGFLTQSGLSLPDRDYYLLDEQPFKAIRSRFATHVQRMLTLMGAPQAAQQAQDIVTVETRLARLHWDRVKNRDPNATYNPYATRQLDTLSPAFDWPVYLQQAGFSQLDQVVIEQPSYVKGLGQLLADTPLPLWKSYLTWHVLHAYASVLPKPYADEDFAFFEHSLNGVEQPPERWKRGVSLVNSILGEVLGKAYVEQHFPPENKARLEVLVQNLISAYGQAIDELDWMSAPTRQAAKAKLAKFSYKIGYPDRWRDYSALQITPDDLIGNIQHATAFEYARDLAKLGKLIDPDEWKMTPQTVNAYYNPQRNEIVFPAAILQPPFFDMAAEDAVNYGGIGAVIGHEISHGFDDQGSQFDGDGNLRNWWSQADRLQFERRTAALAEQYSTYEPLPGHLIDGRFTLGENIADLGGVTMASRAYRLALDGKPAPVIDGLTADQRFFMGWAQVWRRKYTDQNLLNRLKTDPHSPSQYRTNGVLRNIAPFYDAFNVKPGDGMYLAPAKRIKIW
ncbi:putative endopeptidase [Pseudomonas duriflava]|uniref:Putative endopeptidase n=1 Tax=Pseudomonas duriflava TaxID=459528 RepID=A0A562QFZ5_9PSED|nr:M13 family metallopeptidase [Pseudomonas duriflava]TWI54956.1 putative endopeptidase [Pseudomonas duriflava]